MSVHTLVEHKGSVRLLHIGPYLTPNRARSADIAGIIVVRSASYLAMLFWLTPAGSWTFINLVIALALDFFVINRVTIVLRDAVVFRALGKPLIGARLRVALRPSGIAIFRGKESENFPDIRNAVFEAHEHPGSRFGNLKNPLTELIAKILRYKFDYSANTGIVLLRHGRHPITVAQIYDDRPWGMGNHGAEEITAILHELQNPSSGISMDQKGTQTPNNYGLSPTRSRGERPPV